MRAGAGSVENSGGPTEQASECALHTTTLIIGYMFSKWRLKHMIHSFIQLTSELTVVYAPYPGQRTRDAGQVLSRLSPKRTRLNTIKHRGKGRGSRGVEGGT